MSNVSKYLEVLKKIIEAYSLKAEYKSVEEFNHNNDLGTIKILKLFYLYVLFETEAENNNSFKNKYLEEFKFYAMPFGHVESVLYDSLKEQRFNDKIEINKYKSKIVDKSWIKFEELDASNFDKGQKKLYSSNYKHENLLTIKNPFTLVDLSHSLFSWALNYRIAELQDKRSELIPNEDIYKDYEMLKDAF